jgi:hypothetical protein
VSSGEQDPLPGDPGPSAPGDPGAPAQTDSGTSVSEEIASANAGDGNTPLPGDPTPPAHDEAEAVDEINHVAELRHILLRGDETYLTETVESVLDGALESKIEESADQMAEVLAPVMGRAISRQVQDAQDEIVDALYPVIGRMIQRSVTEAMRALAQRVDEGLRSTFSIQRLARRAQGRMRGLSDSEMMLREALPFEVQQVFLIHRESGLLLTHLARGADDGGDSDLISSMLTAIRDFAQDTFGTDREGELDEIQYGNTSILIEPGSLAYAAVVVQGFEPEGYRHKIRQALSAVTVDYGSILRDYDGDLAGLEGIDEHLEPLLQTEVVSAEPEEESKTPWPALAGVAAILLLCIIASCFGGWRLTFGRPTATPTATATLTATATATLTSTATPTHTPTATHTPTPTPTHTPTTTPTATPTSTFEPTPTATATETLTPVPTVTEAPYLGVMIGNVRLRMEPRDDSPLTGESVTVGRPVEILAIYDNWYLIHWPPGIAEGTTGWVPGRWVGVLGVPPPEIITPSP